MLRLVEQMHEFIGIERAFLGELNFVVRLRRKAVLFQQLNLFAKNLTNFYAIHLEEEFLVDMIVLQRQDGRPTLLLVGGTQQAAVGCDLSRIGALIVLFEAWGVDEEAVVQAAESRQAESHLVFQAAALVVGVK